MRLLIIEDDADLAAVLLRGFREEGFSVDRRADGASGLEAILAAEHDLVILDLTLPDRDGLSVCSAARNAGVTLPILMLTVRDSVQDRVAGLEAGADDYLAKPFVFDELLARTHAQLRRAYNYGGQILKVADLELDLLARRAQRAGRRIELTAKEFALLEYFMRRRGQVVTEDDILRNVWETQFDPGTNVVRVYIHHLRSKVDRDHEIKLLHTVRGCGFCLRAEQVP
ncbi:MAG: response regulator transcription factor [Deltaproteobacteria bacterium]|nr:response regulator transcription factor [Deltaproteobacteria bacterium]